MNAPSPHGIDAVPRSPETAGLTASDCAWLWRLARQLLECDSEAEAMAVAAAAAAEGRNRPALARAIDATLVPAMANLRERERLRALAIRDPLTGLYNRRFMEEDLPRRIAGGRPLAVALFDLDGFRDFNASHGHRAGDLALQLTGLLLEDRRRPDDVAFRYGGDEFVLVVAHTTAHDAVERLERLRAALADFTARHDGRRLAPLTASVGVAGFPSHGATAAAVLDAADGALYRAKRGGRDRLCLAVNGEAAD